MGVGKYRYNPGISLNLKSRSRGEKRSFKLILAKSVHWSWEWKGLRELENAFSKIKCDRNYVSAIKDIDWELEMAVGIH